MLARDTTLGIRMLLSKKIVELLDSYNDDLTVVTGAQAVTVTLAMIDIAVICDAALGFVSKNDNYLQDLHTSPMIETFELELTFFNRLVETALNCLQYESGVLTPHSKTDIQNLLRYATSKALSMPYAYNCAKYADTRPF